jgi:hypothetical protein
MEMAKDGDQVLQLGKEERKKKQMVVKAKV